MLGPGDFFGEGCLAGQPVRMGSATAITGNTILIIGKDQMVRLLHRQHALSDRFISHMLARNIRIEEDLIDRLFNSSEKRLARTLLLLAHYGKQNKPVRGIPPISQETLAEMVGTTRSREARTVRLASTHALRSSTTIFAACRQLPPSLLDVLS